jgi:glyoxylase-like metal-dependent hydrolase (beta-lactamase superfamily II)
VPASIDRENEPRELRPGIHAIRVAMPGGPLPYSLCYLIEDDRGGVHIVDPGFDSDDNRAALVAALDLLGHGVDDVVQVLATHLHADHLGLAERVRAASGARIVLHPLEQAALAVGAGPAAAQVPATLVADTLVEDGDVLDVPGRRIRVVHTPGHTRGHICLVDEEARLVFAGDHVLPTVNPGLGLGGAGTTNPLTDYLASLRRIAEYDHCEVAPGHEDVFGGLAERCAELEEHHLRRSREVAAILAQESGLDDVELASRLTWTGGWESLDGFRRDSAIAQAAMHREFVLSAAA